MEHKDGGGDGRGGAPGRKMAKSLGRKTVMMLSKDAESKAMEKMDSKGASGGGGVFNLTQGHQKGGEMGEVKREIAELEQLLASTAQTSQSTQLLKKRKEMKEVDDALELMKRDYKHRMDACEERRLQFELKQAKMREQVLKFEKFIQENDAKRLRAEARAKQERKLYEERCKEISTIMLDIDSLEQQQRTLLEEVARRSCHRAYLELVVEVNDEYEEVADVLNRHRTLVDANADLAARELEQSEEVEDLRGKVETLKLSAQNTLLVAASVAQERQAELEEIRHSAKASEEARTVGLEKEKDVSRTAGEVMQATRNIYRRCEATMRQKPMFMPQHPSLMELLSFELEVLSTRIRDLIDITGDFRAGVDLGGGSVSQGGDMLNQSSVLSLVSGGTGLNSQSMLASKSALQLPN